MDRSSTSEPSQPPPTHCKERTPELTADISQSTPPPLVPVNSKMLLGFDSDLLVNSSALERGSPDTASGRPSLHLGYTLAPPSATPGTIVLTAAPGSLIPLALHWSNTTTDLRAFSYALSFHAFGSIGLGLTSGSALFLSHTSSASLLWHPGSTSDVHSCSSASVSRTIGVAWAHGLFRFTWVSTSIGFISVSLPPGVVSQVSTMAPPSLDSADCFRVIFSCDFPF
ncbi:hypothetical protein DPX16_15147 [Anabarilius grahami]|uniref:Uncharacterized protein n=1 Tax=Anabarilius grahami TaxID=495550 RepID=A0A3N0YV70_ANAGA|nr:hypothetical protein DPX16_15147 [Anabarilius grahami]